MFLNNVFKYLCIYIIFKGNLVLCSSNYYEEEDSFGNRHDRFLDHEEGFPLTQEYEWNDHKNSELSEFVRLYENDEKTSEDDWETYGDYQKSQFEIMKSDNVVIMTENDDGTEILKNDSSKYFLSSDGFAFFYKFKDDVNCVLISYSNKLIWDREVEKPKYHHPKILCFHSDLHMIFIEFEDVLRMYKLTDDFFILLSEKELNGFKSSNLQIMVKDPMDLNKTIPIQKNQYAENCHGFENEYEFHNHVICTEVKYKNEVVWKYNENDSKIKPNSIFFNMYTRMIIIDFPKHYLVYQYVNDKWKFLSRNSLETFSIDDLNFFYKDKKIDQSELDLIDYQDGLTYLFTFKEDVQCTNVKYKNKSLLGFENINIHSIYVNLYEKMLMISGQRLMLVYMYIDGWKNIFSYPEDKDKKYVEIFDKKEDTKELREHIGSSKFKSSRVRPPNNTKTFIITGGVGVSLVLVFLLLFFSLK